MFDFTDVALNENIARMTAKVNAGCVVVPAWHDLDVFQPCLFRNDQGKFVLSSKYGYVTGESVQEVIEEVRKFVASDCTDRSELSAAQTLIALYATWRVIDTTLPEGFARGQTLFALRHDLEEGNDISPHLLPGQLPYYLFIDPDSGKVSVNLPDGSVDGIYSSFDDLCTCNFLAHFPVWIVGRSPQFREQEEAFNEAQRKADMEREAIDNAPPRTIEVSEREYRDILAARTRAEAIQDFPDHPFL